MNRILFEKEEIVDGIATFGGVRADHVLNVLHGEVGQVLKTGEVDGKIGTAVVKSIETSCGCDSSADQPNNRPTDHVRVSVSVCHEEESRRPWVDLILAPPRPRVMKRLLPQLATLGVGRIFLVGAKKVEKDFWGATLLKIENYRPLLIDGLMQAGTSILPVLETRRNFRKFVKDELDALWPSARKIVAHPYGEDCKIDRLTDCRIVGLSDCRIVGLSDCRIGAGTDNQSIRQSVNQTTILLAIGPEGGWTDEEVALLEEHGFARYSLGSRILRTDTATIALLAQLMERFDR